MRSRTHCTFAEELASPAAGDSDTGSRARRLIPLPPLKRTQSCLQRATSHPWLGRGVVRDRSSCPWLLHHAVPQWGLGEVGSQGLMSCCPTGQATQIRVEGLPL